MANSEVRTMEIVGEYLGLQQDADMDRYFRQLRALSTFAEKRPMGKSTLPGCRSWISYQGNTSEMESARDLS